MGDTYDAVIMGGGLAGLTLARQLRIEAPHVRVLVAEKRPHPVAEAAFKVGESSVEIGAHYFHAVLQLEEHLRDCHLRKLGLRYFFSHGNNRDITRRVEMGPTGYPSVPSFQLDRGRLENALLRMLRESGVEALDGCGVRDFDIRPGDHRVTIEAPGCQRREVAARFLIDASGRAGLIRRRLGLTRPVGHGANAAWFRVGCRIDIDDWSADAAWQARVPNGERWHSTNHLMGRGYWVWLIPLGSGSTSIGIVVDDKLHPFSRINRYDRALDWLREFEPQCATIVERHADRREDFLALRHYAHGCERVFSPDGWALVGEAGVFTDPFYSPGSDFIAIGNECAADLIARVARDEDVSGRADSFNTIYLRLFDAFLRLYTGQYPLMGNAQVMSAKAAWDNACYWGVTSVLYFQRRFRRPEFMASIEPLMRRFFLLHARMQQFFNAWDRADAGHYQDAFTNIVSMPRLRELQADLAGRPADDEQLRGRLQINVEWLEAFARSWQSFATERTGLARFVPAAGGPPVDIAPFRLTPAGPCAGALSSRPASSSPS